MDRRAFLVGLGIFAGTSVLWRPERIVFDMGRNAIWTPDLLIAEQPYKLRQIPTRLAYELAIPAYGGVVLTQSGIQIAATGTPTEATLMYTSAGFATTLRQPVINGRATFALPSGEGFMLKVA